jgi:hypothetical protein
LCLFLVFHRILQAADDIELLKKRNAAPFDSAGETVGSTSPFGILGCVEKVTKEVFEQSRRSFS